MSSPAFADFAKLWVVLCLGKDVRRTRPKAVTLAGERIVLFRDERGTARALIDRCPHRGVALSLGKVTAGQITCPFHGWRFDGTGGCTHVPWNPDAKRAQLSATGVPIREISGLIWLFTGRAPDREPVVPAAFRRDKITVTSQNFLWDAH